MSTGSAALRSEFQGRPRFLWTVDLDGRFGDAGSVVDRGARRRRSSARRNARAFHSSLGDRARGRASGHDREARDVLRSGSPLAEKGRASKAAAHAFRGADFDSRRGFAGYRGFGFLDEPIEVGDEAGAIAGRSDPAPSPGPPSVDSADSGARPATEAGAPEAAASPFNPPGSASEEGLARLMDPAQGGAHDAPSFPADDEADGAKPFRAHESADANSSAERASGADGGDLLSRQSGAAPSKIVPIRPGATEALALREPAQGDGESVEPAGASETPSGKSRGRWSAAPRVSVWTRTASRQGRPPGPMKGSVTRRLPTARAGSIRPPRATR